MIIDMKKEVIGVFLVVLLLIPFSSAQLNSIEIKDVNVNGNSIQVLVQNNVNKDFFKEVFIINGQYEIIQEEILSNFTTRFFVVNYQAGIKLNNLQVIVDGNEAKYDFTGQEDTFVINQATTSTSELSQVQESNSPISYIYSNQRLAKIQDNQIVYFSSDNIGSTSLETDSSGSINFKANYLPFGKEISFSSINEEKYGFTGKELDTENSLNYFNARYYNPNNGKFISNDPIYKVTEGGYQYVRNNPLTITDPSGKQSALMQSGKRNSEIIDPVPKTYSPEYDHVFHWRTGQKILNPDIGDMDPGFADPIDIFTPGKSEFTVIGAIIPVGMRWLIKHEASIIAAKEGTTLGIAFLNVAESAIKNPEYLKTLERTAIKEAAKEGSEKIGNNLFQTLKKETQERIFNLRKETYSNDMKSLLETADELVDEGFIPKKQITGDHVLYIGGENGKRIIAKAPRSITHSSNQGHKTTNFAAKLRRIINSRYGLKD